MANIGLYGSGMMNDDGGGDVVVDRCAIYRWAVSYNRNGVVI